MAAKVQKWRDVQPYRYLLKSGEWQERTAGYEIRYNETPQECLRRMERDRKF